jgi:hypothetical protein
MTLATNPGAMEQLRDGLLNAAADYLGEQDIPEGAEAWSDQVTDAAADEILRDVAATARACDRSRAGAESTLSR